MRHIILSCLLVITGLADANVYKCQLPNQQTTYQDAPCSPNTADKNIVKIPTQTPEQKEAALNKLKALEAERQALDNGNKAPQESLEKKEPQESVEKNQPQAIAEKTATGEIVYYPYRGRPKSPVPSYGPRYIEPHDYRNPNYRRYHNSSPYISSGLGSIPYVPNNPNAHFPANSEARSMQGFPANSPASPNFSPFNYR